MNVPMPRDGAIIFSDLIGKLYILNVACAKCNRVDSGSALPIGRGPDYLIASCVS
jgi:hypothetical protein